MIKTEQMEFYIDDTKVDGKDVSEWEFKRLIKTYKRLKKYQDITFHPEFSEWQKNRDIQKISDEIIRVKRLIGFNKLRNNMKMMYTLGNIISKISSKISGNRRKFSVTEIYVPNSELTAAEVLTKIIDIMMKNTEENYVINNSAAPDHYVLRAVDESTQEVLEITGGSPLPTRFFAHYGDETGLQSVFSVDYEVQAPGAARLEDGTVIGGVRHQVKNEGTGFRFKALVEFPNIVPTKMVKKHQIHLACEFGHWISKILD